MFIIPLAGYDSHAYKSLNILCYLNNFSNIFMEQSPKTSNRKKFLLWIASVLSSLTLLKFIPRNKPKETETIKMLTQDGKLVEVDVTKIGCSNRKKISDDELKTWVTNKG